MSEFQFRPAVREQIRLLLAFSGGTGSGKSFTALRIAKGLANGKRFAAIDTENGRLSMYADFFDFDVVNLHAPFTPARYLAAVLAAQAAGYEVILIDSGSHEWDGDGGVLDMQEEELDAMVDRSKKSGDSRPDWQIEEAHRMRSWIHPKMEHKKMMTALTQLKAHVIMCLRAAEKIEIAKEVYKDASGREKTKTVVRPKMSLTGLDGWIPICEGKLPFEFTASFLLTADKPGVPRPIKLQEQHKMFFQLDKPITEEAGRLIGEWAKGGTPKVNADITPKPETKPPLQETKPGVMEPTGQGFPEVHRNPQAGLDKQPNPPATAKMTILEMHQAIARCKAVRALERLGVDIAASQWTDAERNELRDIYVAKLKDLKKSAAPESAGDTANKGAELLNEWHTTNQKRITELELENVRLDKLRLDELSELAAKCDSAIVQRERLKKRIEELEREKHNA